MEKQDIDSILLANLYFIKCKFDKNISSDAELAKNFLSTKIKKALFKKIKSSFLK